MTNFHLLLKTPPSSPKSSQNYLARLRSPEQRGKVVLFSVAFLIGAALMVYAVIRAFVWDEGFHLIAAQLIAAGKRPYIDFCFPQTPFNAYWNALLMLVFGHGWRVTHVFAALLTIATYTLVGEYLYSRFPFPKWRTAIAILGLIGVGLNITVIEFGSIAQAYAMCLFGGFAGFRAAVAAVGRRGPFLAFTSGVLASVGAASSLLSAPVAPVLLIWIFFRNRAGNRWHKTIAFIAGCIVPFAPVIWLFAQGPYQTFFNVFQYQAIFRRVNWGDASSHDIDILSSWVDSGQALLLGIFALLGIVFLRRAINWETALRREFYLCGWISLALVAYISTAHPTFSRYYVVAIPFIAVLAAVGLYYAGSTLLSADRPVWTLLSIALIFTVGAGHPLYVERDNTTWKRYADLTKKVEDVTAKGASFLADEHVYFLMNVAPPSGMEFSYSHKIQLSPKEEALLHIISADELKTRVQKGDFVTLETCNDDLVDQWELGRAYNHRADVGDCYVFWEVNREAHFEQDKKPKPKSQAGAGRSEDASSFTKSQAAAPSTQSAAATMNEAVHP